MRNTKAVEVSIIIVCMNNLRNLYLCLNSISKYNSSDYEVLVVAYLFSKENLLKSKTDFPWVVFIESNEIRGFSENNNLALRQARGKYCFVLNDDTEMRMPVVDRLLSSLKSLPEEVAVLSPVVTFPDGKVQVCGVPFKDWKTVLKGMLHLKEYSKIRKYCNQEGLFQSYNIIGAAFLIKTEIFRTVGWFDEYYFFAPEDIALSTLLNKMGFQCWVDNDTRIVHYEGMSGKSLSKIQTATRPAHRKGSARFYANNKTSGVLYNLLCCAYFFQSFFQFVFHTLKGLFSPRPNPDSILGKGDLHVMCTIFSRMTPKEIFVKYYKSLIDS